MKIIEFTTAINSRSSHVQLIPLGDVHLGVKNCDEDLFQETIDYIRKTKNCYWVGMGDYIEAIKPSDQRMDYQALAKWIKVEDLSDIVKRQSDYFVDKVYPIRHKCIGLLSGNHEEKVRLRDFQSVTDHIALELNTKHLGYVSMIRWHIIRKTKSGITIRNIDIYTTHGGGGGKYIGSKINRLIATCIGFDASIYLMGHVHEKLVHEIPRLRIYGHGDNIRPIESPRRFILTGTFLKGYEKDVPSYAERTMYNPTALGMMTIDIKPFRSTHINGKVVELPPLITVSQ